MRALEPCNVPVGDRECGREDTNLYAGGVLCPEHAPPPGPTPDPERTAEGYSHRPKWNPSQDRYGIATTDPRGPMVDRDASGARFKDRIPRHPCPRCPGREGVPVGHKGEHDDGTTTK